METIIAVAKRNAQKSPLKIKHGSVIFDNSKNIFNSGHNTYITGAQFTIHAEVNVFRRLNKRSKGLSILVLRVSSDGSFKLSKPCIHCIEHLKSKNIQRVFYSTGCDKYPFISESIHNIQNDYKSRWRVSKTKN